MTGRRLAARLLGLVMAAAAPASARADPRLDALVAAYPDAIAGYDAADLILKSGRRLPLSDGKRDKTPAERLASADILDTLDARYPLGPLFPVPATPADDPGRARNQALFDAMYGDCTKGKLALRTVRWMSGAGGSLQVATANGVADRLEDVARDLAALDPALRAYLVPSAGTFNCRAVAGTARMSMHAYAAAIDINIRFADYWRWAGGRSETDRVAYKNRIPLEIVGVFEKHGFIWGGKWYHYDTMHFEYRPEIIAIARLPAATAVQAAPPPLSSPATP